MICRVDGRKEHEEIKNNQPQMDTDKETSK